MEPPKCRLCGERHWSRLCVTPPVTRHVEPVTASVTPKACPQCALYKAEIAALKAQIRKPASAAERAKAYRQRKGTKHATT